MKSYQEKYEVKAEINPFLPSHEIVAAVLRDDISTCVLAPRMHLKEAEMAEQFGVSRTTIRRAFESLLNEEWIVRLPGRGVNVAPLSHRQCKDMLEVRTSVEPLATRLAAAHHTAADLAKLRQYVRLPEDADYLAVYRTDMLFHKAIYYASHNEYITRIYEQIRFDLTRIKFFMTNGDLTVEDKKRIDQEHKAILDAICRRDKKEAYQAALLHARMSCYYKKNSR